MTGPHLLFLAHSPSATLAFGWFLSSQMCTGTGLYLTYVPSTKNMLFPIVSGLRWQTACGEAVPDVILHQSYLLTLAHPALFPYEVLIITRYSRTYLLIVFSSNHNVCDDRVRISDT